MAVKNPMVVQIALRSRNCTIGLGDLWDYTRTNILKLYIYIDFFHIYKGKVPVVMDQRWIVRHKAQ